jgi:hypothetical protein
VKRSRQELRDLLRLMLDDPESMLGLEQATERWGGLAGFGRAYEADEALFEDLCIQDSAFVDGVDLGFSWGLLTAAANLSGMGLGTMCEIAAEVMEGRS